MQELRIEEPGPLRLGSRVLIRQPRLPTQVWTVDHLDEGRSYSWITRSRGITTIAEHRVGPAGSAQAGSAEDFGRFVRDDYASIGQIIKEAGIRAE